MLLDPFESQDLSATFPHVVTSMTNAYDAWFDDVSSTRPNNYDPPRIIIGSPKQNRSVLTRQDWRHQSGKPWGAASNGEWWTHFQRSGTYEVIVHTKGAQEPDTITLKVGDKEWSEYETISPSSFKFKIVINRGGDQKIKTWVKSGDLSSGPHQLEILN